MRIARVLATALATAVVLGSLHLFYRPHADIRLELREGLLWSQLSDLGDHDQRVQRMRLANPEWDFMRRTFVVLALANFALDGPRLNSDLDADHALRLIDECIDETLELERTHGQGYFLMSYWRTAPFVQQPMRSVFVDGEIALMLAVRAVVADHSHRAVPAEELRRTLQRRAELDQRVAIIVHGLETSSLGLLESYPNEGWTFCNSAALAALAISDSVSGTNHRALIARSLRSMRTRLVQSASGLLVSEFTMDGHHLGGPEGSSIFFVAHMLQFVDPAFAQAQYQTARAALRRELLGFAWAAEWSNGHSNSSDVDSGPIIPLLDLSAGASGMAILGAAAFDDGRYLDGLLTTINFAAFPRALPHTHSYSPSGDALHLLASNAVGDAALLYALTLHDRGGALVRLTNTSRGGRVVS